MTQITKDAGEILVAYHLLFKARYHEHWKPSDEHVGDTVNLFRSIVPGIPGYTKEDLLVRLDAFFKCKEDWVVSTKHNYSVFVKHIHRWIHTGGPQHPAANTSPRRDAPYKCPECSNELPTPGEICAKCFPHCSECGMQHSTSDTCKEFAERIEKMKNMFGGDKPRGGEIKTLSGEKAFDDKKEFTEKDGRMLRSK
jgi:hypothetical protein